MVDITKLGEKDKQNIQRRIKEAQKCFKRYQEIAANLFRKCPMSAEVAIRRIQLEIIGSADDMDKKLIKEQLVIIDRNIIPEKDEDKSLFCGLVYLKLLNDPRNAAKFFQKAEEYLRIGYKDGLNDFVNKLENESELELAKDSALVYVEPSNLKPSELPRNDLLFFSRFSRYYSLMQASSQNFVDIIKQLSNEPETSLLEILFYGANVETKENKRKYYTEIIPQVLDIQVSDNDLNLSSNIYSLPVGANGLPYPLKGTLSFHSHWWFPDIFEFTYPLNFFSMQDVTYRLELLTKSQVICHPAFQKESPMAVTLLKKNDLRKCKISFKIPLNEKEIIKSGITHLVFVIDHKLFKFTVRYAIKDFHDAKGRFVDGKTVNGKIFFNLKQDEIQKLKSSIVFSSDKFFIFNSKSDPK